MHVCWTCIYKYIFVYILDHGKAAANQKQPGAFRSPVTTSPFCFALRMQVAMEHAVWITSVERCMGVFDKRPTYFRTVYLADINSYYAIEYFRHTHRTYRASHTLTSDGLLRSPAERDKWGICGCLVVYTRVVYASDNDLVGNEFKVSPRDAFLRGFWNMRTTLAPCDPCSLTGCDYLCTTIDDWRKRGNAQRSATIVSCDMQLKNAVKSAHVLWATVLLNWSPSYMIGVIENMCKGQKN